VLGVASSSVPVISSNSDRSSAASALSCVAAPSAADTVSPACALVVLACALVSPARTTPFDVDALLAALAGV
jgi:hypothetical protein